MDKLLTKYVSGDITPDERKLVVQWINASEANRKEYNSFRKIYIATLWSDAETNKKSKRSLLFIPSYAREILKIAAIFLVVFFVIQSWDYFFSNKDEKIVMQKLYVPPGQRVELTLVDGTRVWLNANTMFTFPSRFANGQREIFLNGEAHFQVTSDKENPFIVRTILHDVEVLGTEFNVSAYSRNNFFETVLMKGAVKVCAHQGDSVILQPNTKVTSTDGVMKVSPIKNADQYRWTEGLMCFEDEPIEELFNKIEAYYDIKIVNNNLKVGKRRYTGKFYIDDGVEHILKILQLNNDFTYSREPNGNNYIIN